MLITIIEMTYGEASEFVYNAYVNRTSIFSMLANKYNSYIGGKLYDA